MTELQQVPEYDANGMYQLRLFVTGASPNSTRAILNLKNICNEFLNGKHELEIIDVHQQPLLVQQEQIVALPMLIKKGPGAERRLIGDMSDREKVLRGLGLS
ncbi:MAG: circadian clock protein KaiB [Mucilaginibacter sp.]|uniref:circadian clock KaiB family protein n=1 Tax=Mucilaginibacter sp. TaxID=1882438 RepID=UPI00263005F5|nr:circadian clock KaiB family protein [Mucilaginibacter sp.]MDB5003126.1 circadian clock protein KaiB [Mucilaginibacter sp.]